ncbi:hypothetical protein [Brevibacillus sp. SYSU BS000544]|uniref:hypothetical protein n=1 Tax=Brevibacillus sp. SYSU BS000544 TaxID=3416443 RepID=UPI003CE55AE4
MTYSEYTLSFETVLKGVTINGSLDESFLNSFNTSYSRLHKVSFINVDDDGHCHTIITGCVTTTISSSNIDVLLDGETLISSFYNKLKAAIMFNMVSPTYGSIPSLQQGEALKITTINQKGAQIPEGPRFYPSSTMVKLKEEFKVPVPINDITTVMTNMNKVITTPLQQKIIDSIQTSSYWLRGANEIGEGNGLTFFNLVSKFRLLWTSFNALYNLEVGLNSEKEQIKNYINNRFYARKLLKDYYDNNKSPIQRLAASALTLKSRRGPINISDELQYHIDTTEGVTTSISISPSQTSNLQEGIMLALYAVRNPIFHGNSDRQPLEHTRECIDILDTLVKTCIKEELANV